MMHPVLRSCIPAILLAVCAAPSTADVWGYVDENGIAHLSNVQKDSRYYLFRKSAPPPAVLPGSASNAVIYRVPAAPASRTTRINPAQRKLYAPLIAQVAQETQINAALLHAVIAVESGYNPRARSPKGAMGLMQLMPDTARRYAVDNAWEPLQNLRGGARYLKDLIALFGNDLTLALAAYNAGEKAVERAGNRIPPFAETRSYVPKVLAHYERYRTSHR